MLYGNRRRAGVQGRRRRQQRRRACATAMQPSLCGICPCVLLLSEGRLSPSEPVHGACSMQEALSPNAAGHSCTLDCALLNFVHRPPARWPRAQQGNDSKSGSARSCSPAAPSALVYSSSDLTGSCASRQPRRL